MTSEERKERRYWRRRTRRNEKRGTSCDNFDEVFSYRNLYRAYQKCRKNVTWKGSVQKYVTQAPLMVFQTTERLRKETWKSSGFYEFDVCERGKTRHIRSVNFDERIVQRCLCDNALVPGLGRSFIYDNAASLQDKGYHFALARLETHLRKHYRKHGNAGYILLFDFRKYFDNVPHRLCKEILRAAFADQKLIRLTEYFLDAFGDKGLGLGSQISQTFALAAPGRIDHYVKDICGIRGYGRYMDDAYVICESKDRLKEILSEIRMICREIGIELNEKKTHIVKLSHGFTFLQARICVTESGKIIRKIPRKSVTRERKKLKKLSRLVDAGRMSFAGAHASFQSWRAYAENFKAWKTIQKMSALFDDLFVWPWAGTIGKSLAHE